jgi:hypothetical protein
LAAHQDGAHGGHARTWRSLGKNGLTYMEDTWLNQSNVGTHFDGMGHIGRNDCHYNQNAMGKIHQ